MATGDGWTSRLLTGLAEMLAANNVGVWRPDGPTYAADEVGILIRRIPPDPDRIVTLAAYVLGDDYPGMADTTQGVQVRLRGTTDPRVCDDLADEVYELLDSAEHYMLGGIHVVRSSRRSYTSLGADSNGRWERSENYAIDAMRPTAHHTN